jgi:hypothetical protein
MTTYTVRLTTEGESLETSILADDCLHAMRQALAVWNRIASEETAVITARRLEPPRRTGGHLVEVYESRRSIA